MGDDGLTLRERTFCSVFLATEGNASAAYRTAYPNASPNTVKTEATRYLAKPGVRAHLRGAIAARLGHREATGQAALGRLDAWLSTVPADLYDEDGLMLPPPLWPPHVQISVVSWRDLGDGRYDVRLVDKVSVNRLVLEITGKVKNPIAEEISAYARLLRGDLGVPAAS